MNRREFTSTLAAFALTPETAGGGKVEVLQLGKNGWMPNNERLPVLLYRGVLKTSGDVAAACERQFEANGWPPQWRNGVYTFHHYHSTAHEVLGFVAGSARLVLGGEGGHELTVNAGDVALLPTGTGHCELSKSADFLVIGAYPPNQQWDICREAPDAVATARMAQLRYPASDPVFGGNGPLKQHWKA